MLFASFPYLFGFLPVVILVCIAVRRFWGPTAAQAWILIASIFFYTRSQPFNLIYLAGSILANWLLARWMARTAEPVLKKRILVSGLTLNLVYLSVFKYLGFFSSLIAFALPKGFVVPQLAFPLGVSFFTITQIMYLTDCYEDAQTPGSLFDHATFVSFFPYLISGPLARSNRMRHQFGDFGGKPGTRMEGIARGMYLFAMGLFKKAVFADAFAQVATYGLQTVKRQSALEAWVFSIAYMLQIYFDFSGYSDMAMGSALMLGIDIPRNFDAPLSSKSLIEFWTRWHISLSQFITTYLYTPILTSMWKISLFTGALATLAAMTIAGLWHGPAWTFVVYGVIHGVGLGVNQYWRKKRMPKLPKFVSWMLTFAVVILAEVFFQAPNLRSGVAVARAMFNPYHALGTANLSTVGQNAINLSIYGLPMLAGVFIAFFGRSSTQRAQEFRPSQLNCLYTVALLALAFVFINSNIPTPFIYFKF